MSFVQSSHRIPAPTATSLSNFATVKRMQTGYTWFLHDEIVKNTKDNICNKVYDLCIIDGPKNWTIDGAAFFFVDKLLKKNDISLVVGTPYINSYTKSLELKIFRHLLV